MAEHNDLGRWGEKLAENYLLDRGYIIHARNWRMHHLEVDLIAFKGNRVVFVEVKTREDGFVDPLKSINAKRMSHLVRAANTFVTTMNLPHEVQFDVITIIGSPTSAVPPVIEHYPDAFLPPLRSIR